MKYLEILFWKIALKILNKGYGYTEKGKEREGSHAFQGDGGCIQCEASLVQDFIREHIELLKW